MAEHTNEQTRYPNLRYAVERVRGWVNTLETPTRSLDAKVPLLRAVTLGFERHINVIEVSLSRTIIAVDRYRSRL